MSSSRIAATKVVMLTTFCTACLVTVPAAWPQSDDRASVEPASASPARLKAKPVTCVALHKDQMCFQTITLSWSELAPGDYCLYIDQRRRPLTCWFNNTLQNFTHEYQSADSMTYELREGSSDEAMATVTVNTSWVYRTGRRSSSGWRLF